MFGSCFLMIDCYLEAETYVLSKGITKYSKDVRLFKSNIQKVQFHMFCAPLSLYPICPVVTKCLILKFLHLTLFLQRRTYNAECELLTEQVYLHAQQPP
jgi:hypothetical protein